MLGSAPALLLATPEVQEGLGRLFVAGPLVVTRPFLGPAFAWVAASLARVTLPPPALVRAVLGWFGEVLERYPWRTMRVGRSSDGELFRIDAKADGDMVVLGGWAMGVAADPASARRFSHRVPREAAPCIRDGSELFRAIASLELLAAVFAIILLVPERPQEQLTAATACLSVSTDNQGNELLLNRWLTTKLPLGVVAMELAAQLAVRNRSLDLRWRHRDLNIEADDLMNERFQAFHPALRVPADGVMARLLRLLRLEGDVGAFGGEVRVLRHRAPQTTALRSLKRKRLREREPW